MEQDGPWYLSGVFWAIVAVVVAVVLGIAAVWATFRSANPRRRLYVYVDRSFPVVRMHEAIHDEIEVLHLGKPLSLPYVVTLNIVIRSRKDIPSSSFDGNRPLVIDLGANIVRLLEEKSLTSRYNLPAPMISVDGTSIRVGPSMLSRQHTLTFTALVDGKPELSTEIPLLDVDSTEERPPSKTFPLRFNIMGFDVKLSFYRLYLILSTAYLIVYFSLFYDGPLLITK